eukprot:TRINITY_DN13186_c0_g1_i1.p1 TRINITY_DN13186_c0_g1~~TRINITY_DN13186_c0_g1_i1.p1  ORF type:complete len:296 (-),score=48.18 TRINITY_DN13186_c0_g1_i1:242-1129(-)
MRKVHLIDAMPYFFRALHALPKTMFDPAGRRNNAVYGFASFLQKYLAEERPTHVAVCFDQSLKTCFRNQIFAEYKRNRRTANRGVQGQAGRCLQVAEVLGLTCFASKKYEADDLIATLATLFAEDSLHCVVVSNDKDLYQLVGPHVTVYDFAKKQRFDAAGVTKKFGVWPRQIPDYLGLIGDSVDCIPGVPGVGHKTAGALLAKFDSIDEIYANLYDVESLDIRSPGSVRRKLESGRDLAFLSRRLVTLVQDVPMRLKGLACLRREAHASNIHEVLRQCGLQRLRRRLDLLDVGG